jgi:ATP-dependent DNA helicase RecQ
VIQLQNLSQGLNAEVQLAARTNETICWCVELSQKILLSYFGELVTENCEIVIFVKSTTFSMEPYSKALSAIIRLQETEPLPVIIDFYAVPKRLYLWKEYQNLKRMV